MRPLRFILVACVLSQLTRADGDGDANEMISAEAEDADPNELSPWTDEIKTEDFPDEPLSEAEEEESPLSEEEEDGEIYEGMQGERTDAVEPIEDTEDLHEEQMDNADDWEDSLDEQRGQELEKREEILHYNEVEDSTHERILNDYDIAMHELRASGKLDPTDESPSFEEFRERRRRLEAQESEMEFAVEEQGDRDDESSSVGDTSSDEEGGGTEEALALDDEDEDEALPIVPGLTDVDLVAFNAEYADEEVLDKIIDWSYDQVAALSLHRDNYIHVEDLYQFLLKTLNPLDEEIDAEDEEILKDAVTELRQQQGLVDDDMVLYRGFIARGMPLRFLQNLARQMHQTVQTRRLQTAGEL